MKKFFITTTLLYITAQLSAQNVFPEKIEGCNTSQFCLDCGDPKAGYDEQAFNDLIAALNNGYNLKSVHGKIAFQVLVDSLGAPCVLSHTDKQKNKLTMDAIKRLNQCKWTPARENGKAVIASINIILDIADGKLTGSIQRIDLQAMNQNMSNPGKPVVYNKSYTYTNPSLSSYEITVWQKQNSGLPQNMSQHNAIDKNDIVWYATFNGLIKFDGTNFTPLSTNNSPFEINAEANVITVDLDDNKWICSDHDIYRYNNSDWVKYTPAQTGVQDGVYDIVPTAKGEVLFCTDQGLSIFKGDKWHIIDTQSVKQLPSNRVYYAYLDKKDRLWIGTFSGSIMIDKDQRVTTFNDTSTPLKNICIDKIVEDDQGNLFMGIYAFGRKIRNKPEEGLVILTADGVWKHFNDTNSGLPSDHVNSLYYDKFEKILWIGTNESGLVRYDLKDGWENYHNENSKVPSSYIYKISQNSKGDLYISTYNGMMRISRKK